MTSLRFVGDLPLWAGLLLSLLLCCMSWRYYSRESFDLPRRMKWFLPLLRSLAFFLGIMMLTSPVLHHRKTIGELGKVQFFLDQSNSMSQQDKHLPAARKLKIAEELGWIASASVDTSLTEQASQLSQIHTEIDQYLTTLKSTLTKQDAAIKEADQEVFSEEHFAEFKTAVQKFREQLEDLNKELPSQFSKSLEVDVLSKFAALESAESFNAASIANVSALSRKTEEISQQLHEEFRTTLASNSASGSDSPAAAITQFDVTSRWRRVELALSESPANILEELRKYHDVDVYSLFGDSAETVQSVAEIEENEETQNSATDVLYSRITDLSSGILTNQKNDIHKGETTPENTNQSAPPQMAIILISDGNHNSGSSPLQMARVLGQQGVQIFGVAIGAESPAADIALIGVEAPDTIFKTDNVRGVLTLRDSMPVGKPFLAQISYEDKVLWQEELVSQNVLERRVEFQFSVQDLIEEQNQLSPTQVKENVRHLKLTASIVPLADESETANNFRDIHLGVITDSHRILILDGRSRWETRYLRNVFERDEKWTVNTIIAGPGTDDLQLPRGEQNYQFPESRDDLFEYDLIIFGEISKDLFQEHELRWLAEFVELRGGGVIFIDGQRGILQSYLDSKIESLLPIEWLNEPIQSLPTELQLTDQGAAESSLRLIADSQKNRDFWKQLPVPHTMIPTKALADAEVLVEAIIDQKQVPAIVTRRVGSGRVLYLAFDESWRWRYKTADLWHQRIWNQLANFVIPRPFSVSDEFLALDTGSVRYDEGAEVEIRARLTGVDGKPVSDATAEALLWKDGQLVANVHLTADGEIPGIYRGTSTSLNSGDYEVSIRASGFSDAALKTRSHFVVEQTDSEEMAQTSANYELLKQMSELTGGEFLREEEISRLPELLSPLSHGRVIESETILWQSYWWFAMIIALLTLEWILRKRAGLL